MITIDTRPYLKITLPLLYSSPYNTAIVAKDDGIQYARAATNVVTIAIARQSRTGITLATRIADVVIIITVVQIDEKLVIILVVNEMNNTTLNILNPDTNGTMLPTM